MDAYFFQISELFTRIYKKSGWWKILSWPAVACLFPSFSQGYHLQTTRDLRPHPSVSLDPAASYHPPQYRSRNQSYMRAVSTLSQASCLSQVSVSRFSYIHFKHWFGYSRNIYYQKIMIKMISQQYIKTCYMLFVNYTQQETEHSIGFGNTVYVNKIHLTAPESLIWSWSCVWTFACFSNTRRWIGYTKLAPRYECVNVHGTLWCTSVPSKVYTCLMHSVPRVGPRYTMTLTRIKFLWKMNEQMK